MVAFLVGIGQGGGEILPGTEVIISLIAVFAIIFCVIAVPIIVTPDKPSAPTAGMSNERKNLDRMPPVPNN